jgi:nitrilase
MKIAAAQLSPVLCDRQRTLEKICAMAREAAAAGVKLVAFPETILPGYPTWLARTDGAAFDDDFQKTVHARYLDQAVELPGPELVRLLEVARELDLTLIVGVAERERGTIFATALWVHPDGRWLAHRKLVPTYEERLAWGWGDGHGLRVQDVCGWKTGALNCWENWMPAARLALYGQGEELHVSLWPGNPELTRDHARFVAREGRVWVLAASGVMTADDVASSFPGRERLLAGLGDGVLHGGGSRIVGPDGNEVAALDETVEGLVTAELDRTLLQRERQNFDPAGHYHRPDVFDLRVDRRRRSAVSFND